MNVFYFSGTGNSFYDAKEISKRAGKERYFNPGMKANEFK
jgi:flavodoxin